MVLDDDVVQRIAEGCELLARPRSEGGIGDIQAFHALMLLIRTGRRVNEILMMDFDPLIPLHRATNDSPAANDQQAGDFVARMRYQQTKIESNIPNSIPVDAEVVAIIKAQQQVACDFMSEMGAAQIALFVPANPCQPQLHLPLFHVDPAQAAQAAHGEAGDHRLCRASCPDQ